VRSVPTVEGCGPEGGHLLGFLCALGTLACLHRAWPEHQPGLGWVWRAGAWRPCWTAPGDENTLVRAVHEVLTKDPDPPGVDVLGEDLTVAPGVFRDFLREVERRLGPDARREADFALAHGTEVLSENGRIQDTALRTMSGVGHQHFLGSMSELGRLTTAQHIREALFEPWSYRDSRPSMRWDPMDDRRYAYRADNPARSATNPIRTVRGANRLAVEALPFFPTVLVGRELHTTGFRRRNNRWFLRWPVWEDPVPLDVVRSLLTLPDLWGDELDAQRLALRGIREVFECERVRVDRYRSFTAARALLGRSYRVGSAG
jgi:hypothetical protein